MKKHFFFDLDNTLTPSKYFIEPVHIPVLKALCEKADVIVVSGHGEKDIRAHLTPELEGKYHVLGQNGNHAATRDGKILWNNALNGAQKNAILDFIALARAHIHLKVTDENDIIDDRESQIAYSLIGHHEDREKKEAFDPRHAIRLKLLADLKDEVEKLKAANVEVRSGGTTVLDFFELGKNKGYNVREFIQAMGWKPQECLYIGDALFPGGNDETVIGVIDTQPVNNYKETYEYISKNLLS